MNPVVAEIIDVLEPSARLAGSVALGAPSSTGLLSLDGLFGPRGWQIMYITETIPTVAAGFLTLLVLTDRPE